MKYNLSSSFNLTCFFLQYHWQSSPGYIRLGLVVPDGCLGVSCWVVFWWVISCLFISCLVIYGLVFLWYIISGRVIWQLFLAEYLWLGYPHTKQLDACKPLVSAMQQRLLHMQQTIDCILKYQYEGKDLLITGTRYLHICKITCDY